MPWTGINAGTGEDRLRCPGEWYREQADDILAAVKIVRQRRNRRVHQTDPQRFPAERQDQRRRRGTLF